MTVILGLKTVYLIHIHIKYLIERAIPKNNDINSNIGFINERNIAVGNSLNKPKFIIRRREMMRLVFLDHHYELFFLIYISLYNLMKVKIAAPNTAKRVMDLEW